MPKLGELPNGPQSKGAIYFVVGDRESQVNSFAWRIGWNRTSFYIKTQTPEASANLKVSLHGADPRHPTGPIFKVDRDNAETEDRPPQGLVASPPDWLPCSFDGRVVHQDVKHALRFRFPWALFHRRYPTAAPLREVRSNSFAGIIPPPRRELDVVDVDIFVSQSKPYWPNERKARRDKACLGPLQNKAGEVLTGVSVHRSSVTTPTPLRAQAPRPVSNADRTRGIAATVDDSGVLWICEQWMSRTTLNHTN